MKILKILAVVLIIPAMIYADSVYNRVISSHKLIIGVSKSYPPLNQLEKGKRTGVEMEMIRSLGEYLNVKVELVPLDVSEYVSALETGKVNLVIAGMSRSLERSRKIWFSVPYLTIHPAGLVDKRILRKTDFGEDIQSQPVSDLWELKKYNNVEFGIKVGSIYNNLVKEEFPGAGIVGVKTNEEALDLLYDFKINVFIHDSLFLEYLIKKNPSLAKSFVLLKANNLDEYLCVGLPFGDIILKNQIDTWIEEIIRTKKMKSWVEKYITNEN